MIIDNNKQKGNTGLSLAIGYYGANGYTVSVPLNDTQDYDIIVDKVGLERVQVKFTSYKEKSGYYNCDLKSCGGTKGKIYKTVKNTSIDILFIVTPDKKMYEIPIEDITQTSNITLNKSKDKYIVEI